MEKDFMSSLRRPKLQMPGAKSPFQRFGPNGNCPVNVIPLPAKTNEPHGWFYCLPRFRQSFISEANMALDMKPASSGCATKQFLVFDQSGGKTTMVCLNSWSSNSRSNGSDILKHEASKEDNVNDENEAEARTEMQEDSDEINALLYSDDESDHGRDEYDDDTASTGLSPSTMTDHGEAAGSSRPMKKQRVSVGGRDRSLIDDAQSKGPDYDDDGDSMCGMKRLKKVKIREAVDILRKMIPDGKGKDSAMVLDESIRYLRSSKLKADSFGLPYVE